MRQGSSLINIQCVCAGGWGTLNRDWLTRRHLYFVSCAGKEDFMLVVNYLEIPNGKLQEMPKGKATRNAKRKAARNAEKESTRIAK